MSKCKPPVCTGDLRTPFLVERAATADDGEGGQTVSWSTVGTYFGKVSNSGGGERFVRDRLEAPQTIRIWARYGADVTEKDRITINSRVWNVRIVTNWMERNAYIKIIAEAEVPT